MNINFQSRREKKNNSECGAECNDFDWEKMRLEMRNGTNLRAIDSFMNELNSSLSMNGDVKFFSSSEYQLVISMNVRFELVQ